MINKKYKVNYADGLFKAYENTVEIKFSNKKMTENILVAYESPNSVAFIEGIIGLSFQ